MFLTSYVDWEIVDQNGEKIELPDSFDEEDILSTITPNQLTDDNLAEFFEWFLIRKFPSSESFMKQSTCVLKKFTKWLADNDYILSEDYDVLKGYFSDNNKSASLPNAIKLSELLYQYAGHSPPREYEEKQEVFLK